MLTRERFLAEISSRIERVEVFLEEQNFSARVGPDNLRRAVSSYLEHGGKRLRPALLLLACEVAGGDAFRAIPAAAAVEVFHTWTLVHDDVIDGDDLRRGKPTVHAAAASEASLRFGCSPAAARGFGVDTAILAGDIQQGWSVCAMLACAERGVPGEIVRELVRSMESDLLTQLIEGEMLDVEFSYRSLATLSEADILRMMELKTGALLEFSARAGAMIGAGTHSDRNPFIARLGNFARCCGIAFQLQDDVLGVTGERETLGKPVGSDIREGKRTVIVQHALAEAGAPARVFLERILGDRMASEKAISRARSLLVEAGGVDYARRLAGKYSRKAMAHIAAVPPSPSKDLLVAWADFLTRRDH